jgi:mannose-6-phosphate isomerase
VVAVGPFAGSRLGELTQTYADLLVGTRAIDVFGHRFPLLAKFLDARDRLSVQVHPDDAYAAAHEGGKLGKTESWYVLDAEPGAQLVYGLACDCDEAAVRQAIAETRLEDLLYAFEAHPGDVILVPAGTLHAIGGGIMLYELQEYSDVTYRLYDYGRRQADGTLRELHVDKGLAVTRFQPAEVERVTPVNMEAVGNDGSRRVLVACRYFVEEELCFTGAASAQLDGSSCHIVTVLDGAAQVQSVREDMRLAGGDTVVLPASLGEYWLVGEQARLVRSYVPRPDDENLRVWRSAQPAIICE